MLARVKGFSFALISQIMNLPAGSYKLSGIEIKIIIEKKTNACFVAFIRGENSFITPFCSPQMVCFIDAMNFL